MKWITIVFLAPAVAWTAISFLAYRDPLFAFQSSLVAWIVFGLAWGAVRVSRLGLGEARKPSKKAKTPKGSRFIVAGVVAFASLAVVVAAVFAVRWLDSRAKVGLEGLPFAVKSGTGRSPEQPEPSGEKARVRQNGEALWAIQVSAFRSKQSAVDFAAALKERGYDAYVTRAEVDLYRIQVGRFKTRDEANRALQRLRDEGGYATAFVAKM